MMLNKITTIFRILFCFSFKNTKKLVIEITKENKTINIIIGSFIKIFPASSRAKEPYDGNPKIRKL